MIGTHPHLVQAYCHLLEFHPRRPPGAYRSVHLTNDAVQRQYGHYNSFEDHNKLDMSALQSAVDRQGLDINVLHDVVPQMHAAAAFVFGATLPSLNAEKLQSCFEILGLDFMVNVAGKVYRALI